MASSSTYAFFQSAFEVPHCSLQHLSWNTTNFILDSLFQFIQCPWPSRVDLVLKAAPQEKITNGQIRWSWGPGNVTESCDDMVTEQFSNSCHWLPCSVRCRTVLLKPGFVKLWKTSMQVQQKIATSQHTHFKSSRFFFVSLCINVCFTTSTVPLIFSQDNFDRIPANAYQE